MNLFRCSPRLLLYLSLSCHHLSIETYLHFCYSFLFPPSLSCPGGIMSEYHKNTHTNAQKHFNKSILTTPLRVGLCDKYLHMSRSMCVFVYNVDHYAFC